MKQTVVGVYCAGQDQIEIVLREGYGAEFFSTPEKGMVARMKIGVDDCDYRSLMSMFFHELFEFLLLKKGVRFEPSNTVEHDHSAYLFTYSHTVHTDVCQKAAMCAVEALPDLKRALRVWRKKHG